MDFQQRAAVVESLESPRLRNVDWTSIRSAAYLIHQRFEYRYPGDIERLRQRLMVVPPERHGDQRLVTHKIEVSSPTTEVRREVDQFGNLSLSISVDYVARAIAFTVWLVIERELDGGPIVVAAQIAEDPAFVTAAGLTALSPKLEAAAARMAASGDCGQALAARISRFVQESMDYAPGTTDVCTTAAEAFTRGRGVCQDFSHIMIALCRRCGLPARYVSGHLLGEGGTHAWVEVMLPDPDRPGRWHAMPFDPTNASAARLNYVTIAVGRDYSDVAPTSGTYLAPFHGELTAGKRAGMVFLTYSESSAS